MPRVDFHVLGIGFAVRALEPGSREQERMLAYARRLQSYHLIVYTRKRDGYAEPVTIENLTVYPTNARSKLGIVLATYRIGKQILRDANAEQKWVISCQDPFESTLLGRLLARRVGARVQMQLHADVFGPRWRFDSLLSYVRYWYGRYTIHRADCIRVVSERIKRSLVSLGVPADRIHTVPIQPVLEPFLAVGRERQGVDANRCHFLYVGRMYPEKNLPLILRSFAQIAPKAPQATLEFVGAGPEETRLKTLIDRFGLAGRVKITSWTNNVPQQLAQADVLVLASDHEGWGMVLVEAMAAGLSVVTTDVGCAGEVVKDRRHGFVVPVRDTERFAAAMERLAVDSDIRRVYGETAYQTARTLRESDAVYLEKWVNALTCD